MTQNGRFKSGLEISLNKSLVKRKAYHGCGVHGHNNRTCKKKKRLIFQVIFMFSYFVLVHVSSFDNFEI